MLAFRPREETKSFCSLFTAMASVYLDAHSLLADMEDKNIRFDLYLLDIALINRNRSISISAP